MSGVFQNIDPPPPLHPASVRVCPPPAPKAGGTRSPGSEGGGGGGSIILKEDARHWIGLLQYNPSTGKPKDAADRCIHTIIFEVNKMAHHTTHSNRFESN